MSETSKEFARIEFFPQVFPDLCASTVSELLTFSEQFLWRVFKRTTFLLPEDYFISYGTYESSVFLNSKSLVLWLMNSSETICHQMGVTVMSWRNFFALSRCSNTNCHRRGTGPGPGHTPREGGREGLRTQGWLHPSYFHFNPSHFELAEFCPMVWSLLQAEMEQNNFCYQL